MSANLIKYANAYPGRVTVLATVVLAVLYVLWTKHRWDVEAKRRTWWRDLEIRGVVEGTKSVPEDHGETHVFVLSNGTEMDLRDPLFYRVLGIGDSLFKQPGEGVAYIRKLDGSKGEIELFKHEQTLFSWD